MNAVNATDDELALAMLLYLRDGPGSPGMYPFPQGTWLSTRADTAAEYRLRFPRNQDKFIFKGRRKA